MLEERKGKKGSGDGGIKRRGKHEGTGTGKGGKKGSGGRVGEGEG